MDGAALAARIRAEVAAEVAEIGPLGLATVLVGDDPASHIYIGRKHEAAREAGIAAHDHKLPADTSEEDLLALVGELNADDSVDGILVQLPLPDQIDEGRVLRAVSPRKDVDGFHPASAGSSTSTSRPSSRRRRSGSWRSSRSTAYRSRGSGRS